MDTNYSIFELRYVVYNGVIVHDYLISPFGRVINGKTHKRVKPREMKNSHGEHLQGYMIIDIFIGHKKVTALLHRLVAETYLPNPKSLPTVNHKNGDKHMNYCFNLEWSSYRDNNIHALKTGLCVHSNCENHPKATLKNEQVHLICKLLETGMTYDKIIDILELSYIENIKSKIKMIKTGNAWTDISCQYNFPEGKNREPLFDEEIIHAICRYLCDNGFTSYKEIVDELGLPSDERFKRLIYSIRKRKKYKYITSKYDFT